MSIFEPLIRHNAPPLVRKYLKNHGDDEIISITVCRMPIQSGIDKFVNIITAGKYEKNKIKLNYDDMYHLYLFVQTNKNERYRYEKNHVVSIKKQNTTGKECIPVQMKGFIKVSDFFKNGQKYQGDDFWLYDARTNNCQVFIESLLAGNGLLDKDLLMFVKQDAEQIIDENVGKIARYITDIAGVADRLVYGKGRMY